MFSTVSWHDFLMSIIVLLFIYYSILILLFYRNDIVTIMREGIPKRHSIQGAVSSEQSSVAGDLLPELQAIFIRAGEKQYPQQELLQALRSCLNNYSRLKDTTFETAVNNHIRESALAYCNIVLEDSDIKQLW